MFKNPRELLIIVIVGSVVLAAWVLLMTYSDVATAYATPYASYARDALKVALGLMIAAAVQRVSEIKRQQHSPAYRWLSISSFVLILVFMAGAAFIAHPTQGVTAAMWTLFFLYGITFWASIIVLSRENAKAAVV